MFLETKNVFFLTLTFLTELYLEELSDVVVATDIQCQTDAFLDRPATPLFIPAKSGKDVETQIEEGEVGNLNRIQRLNRLNILYTSALQHALLTWVA